MSKLLNLKKLRSKLNLSQADMADRLGVDQATISRIERGLQPLSKPVTKLLEQIASAA